MIRARLACQRKKIFMTHIDSIFSKCCLHLSAFYAEKVYVLWRRKKTFFGKHFYPFFELTSDSLTNIEVKPHRCPSHQFILLTQGPIREILRIGRVKNLKLFWVGHFDFFLLNPYLFKSVTIYGVPKMGRNFDDCPDFQKNQGWGVYNYETVIQCYVPSTLSYVQSNHNQMRKSLQQFTCKYIRNNR